MSLRWRSHVPVSVDCFRTCLDIAARSRLWSLPPGGRVTASSAYSSKRFGPYNFVVTVVNLRAVRLASGELYEDRLAVELEPLELGGERYQPVPERPAAVFAMTRATSGTVFRLSFRGSLAGPCVRCLGQAAVPVRIDTTEYQASSPATEEERTPYVRDDRLDVSAWARDAVALALPEKILCREDCAGLCAGCGANLNLEVCHCPPPEVDPRLAPLAELRDRLRG